MEHQQRGMWSVTPGRAASCADGGSTNMRLSITSTAGGPLELTVPRGETVEGLRTRLSGKLRLQTDKMVLLHKDRQLTTGRLLDQGVADGTKLTLVPVIEAGLVFSTVRAQRTMMDVLESLSEDQINDFLSGRSPLNIKLGIGAHTMYVQLQLSAKDVAQLRDQASRAGSNTSHLGSASATGSTTSAPCGTQRPTTAPCHCHSYSHHSCPTTPSSVRAVPTLSSGIPHPSCPQPGTTPVCTPNPTQPSPGPPSPQPAATFKEASVPSAGVCKQPGAVIESLVSHSPGVFSGTFSGTLDPCSQSRIHHPRHGIAVILQILNDLLRAASCHQGALQSHCPASKPSTPAEEPTQVAATPDERSTKENQTLHCKLQRLQSLMDQRRLRRRTHRSSHHLQTSHPYSHRRHQP